jgi:hypothetical protein
MNLKICKMTFFELIQSIQNYNVEKIEVPKFGTVHLPTLLESYQLTIERKLQEIRDENQRNILNLDYTKKSIHNDYEARTKKKHLETILYFLQKETID